MKFKSLQISYIFQIFLLSASILVFFISLFIMENILLSCILFLLIIYLAIKLYHNISLMNRVFISFLEAIKYEDYTFSTGRKNAGFFYEELNTAFLDVATKMKKTRLEKEKSYQHLQTVVRHINTGLISFDSDGKVNLFNQSAKKIFNINRLKHISDLAIKNESISSFLLNITPGKAEILKVQIDDQLMNLSFFASKYVLMGHSYYLVSIQNIRKELEEKEIDAWQKLIRVLMHEILNSMAPITSLASTTLQMIDSEKSAAIDDEALADICTSLKTIEKRSKGLMTFVNSYRKLSHLPKPDKKTIKLKAFLSGIESLLINDFMEKSINFDMMLNPDHLELYADPNQIEQVIINLLKNASESSMNSKPLSISLEAFINVKSRVSIRISDTGQGISPENIDKIFIPFFSTKEKGSGIGLSLSQQIMRLHGGAISVMSEPKVKTEFLLEF